MVVISGGISIEAEMTDPLAWAEAVGGEAAGGVEELEGDGGASGDVLSSGADACDLAATSHVPVKPARVALESDVNVTLRKPVVELYTVDALRVPESLAIRSVDSHAAVTHRKIDT